jgi:hypothetical protein
MNKTVLSFIALLCCISYTLSAQKTTDKVKNATQRANQKSAQVATDVQETANNVNATVNNVQTILRVFDPFLVQIRRTVRGNISSNGASNTSNGAQNPQNNGEIAPNTEGSSQTPLTDNGGQQNGQGTPNQSNGTAETASPSTYNSDGTAAWGCQDHQQYGCYLDAQKGVIADDVDVATQTGAIDVIFATAKSQIGPIYHLVSPSYAKNNPKAGLFFSGEKYKVGKQPVKLWATANSSEIAATTITGAQFEKVKSNEQLMAVVNQTGGFQEFYSSRTKLDGKVFAVRTQIENRTSYALIYVVEHVGVSGSGCFLKIKLKVNGRDANGDGLPDDTN